jgi:formate hydrogenlyase subunit 4
MGEYLAVVIQTLLAVALAPALTGFVRWLKARLQGRRGAPPWQPYLELRKLFAKELVVSQTASWLLRVAPFVVFSTSIVVASLLPLVFVPVSWDRAGDLFAAVYLLLLGTFFLALAGLDSGSPFGGMGSSREMTVVALTEPTVALSVFALALTAGSTNFGEIVRHTLGAPASALGPAHVLGFAALFVVALAETGRLPVDNPSTHLELTMIHEAMVLEYSGRQLALIEWAASVKQLVLMMLLANVFFAPGLATDWSLAGVSLGVLALLGKLLLLAGAVVLVEFSNAKLRLFRVPDLLSVAFVLAALALISTFLFT